MRNSIARGASETSSMTNVGGATLFPYEDDIDANPFSKYKDVTKNQAE